MLSPFEVRYRLSFAALGIELRAADGCPDIEIAAAERRLDLTVPPALRGYFLSAGHEHRLNRAHNRLLRPGEWFTHAGRLVFLEENQNVVLWGVRIPADDHDPPVEQGVNGDDVEWYPEHPRCSDFLVVMLHWQAVMGGFGRTWSATVDSSFSEKLQSWNALGSINELRAYTRDGVALCWLPWTDGPRIFVAGADHARVDALASQFNVEWDPDYR